MTDSYNETISVIIPVYNSEPYIHRCLQSILKNTYSNLEIICINDGSNDKSEDILLQFAKSDSRIHVVTQENGGVARARNKGLAIATGKYIAFVDSDDWVHRQYFEILYNILQKYEADIVVCDELRIAMISNKEEKAENYVVNISEKRSLRLEIDDVLKIPAVKNYVWGRLYCRNTIEGITFPEGVSLGEDTIFNLSAMMSKKNKIIKLECPLYYYYQREDSLVHTFKSENVLSKADAFLAYADYSNQTEEYQIVFIKETMKSLLAYRYGAMFLPEQNMIKVAFEKRWKKLKHTYGYHQLKTIQKCQYSILRTCPFLYRVMRILGDKTLLIWERQQRRKKKDRKR